MIRQLRQRLAGFWNRMAATSRISLVYPLRGRRARRRKHAYRPTFEALEERLAPAAGDLDTTFGSTGIVQIPNTPAFTGATNVTNLPDGNILVAGIRAQFFSTSDLVLARLDQNGALDPSFNGTGVVLTPVPAPATNLVHIDMAVDGEGRIVIGAHLNYEVEGDPIINYTAVFRFSANGTPDSSFADAGIFFRTEPQSQAPRAVAVDSQNRIVLARWGGVIERLTESGVPDTSFNGTGELTITFPGFAFASLSDLVIDGQDRIIAGGFAGAGGEFALARVSHHGSLDPTFGAGGTVTTTFFGAIGDRRMAIDANGGILLVGSFFDPVLALRGFALARYTDSGNLLTDFGTDGRVVTSFPGQNITCFGATFDSNGKIVVAGRRMDSGPSHAALLARYEPAGALPVHGRCDS